MIACSEVWLAVGASIILLAFAAALALIMWVGFRA